MIWEEVSSVRRVAVCNSPPNWIHRKRKGKRVRRKIIEYIENHCSGRYAIGPKHIAFELEEDYIIYLLRFPT